MPFNTTLKMQHKMRTMLKGHTVSCATKTTATKSGQENVLERKTPRSRVCLKSGPRFHFEFVPWVSIVMGKRLKCLMFCVLKHHVAPVFVLLHAVEVIYKKQCKLIETIKHFCCRAHCALCLLLNARFNAIPAPTHDILLLYFGVSS